MINSLSSLGPPSFQPAMGASSMRRPGGPPDRAAIESTLGQIQNEDGVSLRDMKDTLRSAAQAAAANGEDVGAAITSTLESHGFDAEAVKAELGQHKPSGFGMGGAMRGYGQGGGMAPGFLMRIEA